MKEILTTDKHGLTFRQAQCGAQMKKLAEGRCPELAEGMGVENNQSNFRKF